MKYTSESIKQFKEKLKEIKSTNYHKDSMPEIVDDLRKKYLIPAVPNGFGIYHKDWLILHHFCPMSPKGGITVLYNWADKEYRLAFCSPKDNYSRREGIIRAVNAKQEWKLKARLDMVEVANFRKGKIIRLFNSFSTRQLLAFIEINTGTQKIEIPKNFLNKWEIA